jgi:uncharacterized repeat protein (TIGR03847 family)
VTESTDDFGRVTLIEAETFGEPGQRTFRLRIGAPAGNAFLWLEKEQMQALSLAIRQILSQRHPRERPELEEEAPAPSDYPAHPAVDFKVGRLALGYDESEECFTLSAHDLEADPEGPATFTCETTTTQARALSDAIERIVAAGRPRCFLCGEPIEAGHHVCPRSNGHGQLQR